MGIQGTPMVRPYRIGQVHNPGFENPGLWPCGQCPAVCIPSKHLSLGLTFFNKISE